MKEKKERKSPTMILRIYKNAKKNNKKQEKTIKPRNEYRITKKKKKWRRKNEKKN